MQDRETSDQRRNPTSHTEKSKQVNDQKSIADPVIKPTPCISHSKAPMPYQLPSMSYMIDK